MISRLSKNIIYNLFGRGLVLIIGFVAVKYIFNRLGADALGIIYFTAVINTILSAVLEMGVSATTVREISAHFGLDSKYIKDLIRTFSFFYWSIYALAAVVIFFLAPVIVERWINISTMSPATVIHILRVLGITSILALPKSFYGNLLCGLQRMEFTNFIDVITIGLQQFGVVFILAFWGGLFPVIYWFAATYILRVIIYFFVSAHFFTFSALIPGFSFAVIQRNLKFALRTTLISIISTIHTQADKLIISKLLPIGTMGYYSVAYSSVSQGNLLTNAISQAAYPSFSALFKTENKDSLLSQYRKLQDLVCFSILPIFAAISFALIPLFSYLLNEKIAYLLLLPTTFLCFGFFMNGTLAIPYIVSLAVGKPEITVKMNFYALFVVLPVTVILIYFFGLIGAGLSWVFYNIFAYFYGVPRICKECIGIKVRDWYFHIFKIIILAVLTYGVSWFVLETIGALSIIPLVLAYLVASIIFIISSYFMIGKELRETLSNYLRFILRIKILK